MTQNIKNRTRQWWQPKAGLILSAVYLSVLINEVSFPDLLIYFLPAVITILGIGVLGYFINDFFDRKYDEIAQKNNMLHNKSGLFLMVFFLSSLLVALLPWFSLPYNAFSIYLLGAEFLLLSLYAIPPVRLKERGFAALLADALYAYVIPFVLAFHTFSLLGNSKIPLVPLYTASACWLLIAGIYNLAIHQVEDYDNDKQANIKTWVGKLGKTVAFKWSLHYLWTLQMLGFLCLSATLFFYHSLAGIALGIITLFKITMLFLQKGIKEHYTNTEAQYLQWINFHYHAWLPYLLIFILIAESYFFIFILAAHFLLFNYKHIVRLWKNHVRILTSYAVNYFIYYFFLMFGINLKKEKKSAMEYLKDKLK